MKYLTIASCLKNEEPYMRDFVTYHRYVGVDHFLFFDRTYGLLKEMFKNDPDVEVIHFPEGEGRTQQQAWAEGIKRGLGTTKWLACIDGDEALVPVQTDNVKNILKNYEEFASLQVNWHTFGSNGHIEYSPIPVYERFTVRARANDSMNGHTQFICQPDRTLALPTLDPHHPRLAGNEISVNTNKEKVTGPFNKPPLQDIFWIAHYLHKSREEYRARKLRGRADVPGQMVPFEQFNDVETYTNVETETRVLELWRKANIIT